MSNKPNDQESTYVVAPPFDEPAAYFPNLNDDDDDANLAEIEQVNTMHTRSM